ncbi:MAG: trigger factor [Defluviitaleaceae bacterium]|nr:trigger factor [Defluviitaleaceae bacterium]MCL2239214.1 trigger factor [Defluviitaleaceae bacterium]
MRKFYMELTTVTTESLEENKSKLTIQVNAEAFKQSLQAVYNKNKGYFNIPGFRKGKAPRMIIEQYYGKEIFHEDAINYVLEDAYAEALDKSGIDAVYRPEIALEDVSEQTGIAFTAEVYTRPAVEIDGYYGLTYPKIETEPSEDEIQNALRAEQEKNARQVSADRPAALNDIVNINFTGYVDGEPFEGGKGEFVDLTLGSGRFIPGFEEQLVGHVTGDDVTVNVTFPEDYNHTDLAGKPAVFEVEIVDVKERQLPELDDDFAQDISEFDTLAEYRADLAEHIRKNKEDNLDHNKRAHIMQQLAKMIVANVPEVMYTGRMEDMLDSYRNQIEMQGMDFENYMRFSGLTEHGLRSGWQAQAKQEIDSMLALTAIADKENITLSDEEFTEKFSEFSGIKDEELTKLIEEMHPRRKADLRRSYRADKAMDFVMEKAIATDEPFPVIDEITQGDIIDVETTEEEK